MKNFLYCSVIVTGLLVSPAVQSMTEDVWSEDGFRNRCCKTERLEFSDFVGPLYEHTLEPLPVLNTKIQTTLKARQSSVWLKDWPLTTLSRKAYFNLGMHIFTSSPPPPDAEKWQQWDTLWSVTSQLFKDPDYQAIKEVLGLSQKDVEEYLSTPQKFIYGGYILPWKEPSFKQRLGLKSPYRVFSEDWTPQAPVLAVECLQDSDQQMGAFISLEMQCMAAKTIARSCQILQSTPVKTLIIQGLSLSHPFSHSLLQSLARSLPHVESVKFKDCKPAFKEAPDFVSSFIQPFRTCSCLTVLEFKQHNLKDEHFKSLPSVSCILLHLKSLDLSENKLKWESMEKVFPCFPALKALNVSKNLISDMGGARLWSQMHQTHIAFISVDKNYLSPEIFQALTQKHHSFEAYQSTKPDSRSSILGALLSPKFMRKAFRSPS